MTNVTKYYIGVADIGLWFQKVAAELGKTPTELFFENEGDLDMSLLSLVKDYTIGDGWLTAQLRGDLTLTAQFVPSTLVVTQVRYHYDGQLALEWQGQMSAQQFLTDDWPESVIYGSGQVDVLDAVDGSTVYAGAGNDLIVLWGNGSRAYGQSGNDVFLVDGFGAMTISDYQPGERIIFGNYESLAELAADFKGVQVHGNGFTVLFKQAYGPDWSLTFENLDVSQLRLEDLGFADPATLIGVWQPMLSAYGIDMSALEPPM